MSTDRAPSPSNAREELQDLRETVASLQDRVEDLEAENERLRDQLEEERKMTSQQIAVAKGDVSADIEEVQDEIESEQQQRSQADAVLERKIATVAEASDADVDIEDAAMGMDKITRLIKIGPDDVVDRVYAVHERAQVLLENLSDWGDTISDAKGPRLQITAPEAAEKIGLVRAENVSSEQVKRVFEKIDELAADSPRRVSVGKNGEDVLHLQIELEDGDRQ